MPDIHFTLRHNERQVFELAADDGWLERIARFFGRELAEQPDLGREQRRPGADLRLCRPILRKAAATTALQYFFLNGRHIRDHALQHALGEAYRGLLMTGRSPIAFMRFEMPAELVDVNVHPTKLEVRFQDSGRLYSQLLATLRRKFLTTDLNTQLHTAQEDPTGGHDEARAAELRQQLVDWAKGKVAAWQSPPRRRGRGSGRLRPDRLRCQPRDGSGRRGTAGTAAARARLAGGLSPSRSL